jgi:hypothetical protein
LRVLARYHTAYFCRIFKRYHAARPPRREAGKIPSTDNEARAVSTHIEVEEVP